MISPSTTQEKDTKKSKTKYCCHWFVFVFLSSCSGTASPPSIMKIGSEQDQKKKERAKKHKFGTNLLQCPNTGASEHLSEFPILCRNIVRYRPYQTNFQKSATCRKPEDKFAKNSFSAPQRHLTQTLFLTKKRNKTPYFCRICRISTSWEPTWHTNHPSYGRPGSYSARACKTAKTNNAPPYQVEHTNLAHQQPST